MIFVPADSKNVSSIEMVTIDPHDLQDRDAATKPGGFLRGAPNRIVFNAAPPANPRWRSRWRRQYGLGMAKPRAAGPAARAFFVPRDVRYRAASPKRMGDDTADRDAIVWSVCAAWLQHDCRGHATIFRKAAIGRVSDSGERGGMPKTKGKIPRITFEEGKPIALSDENWSTIEEAYGHPISEEVRTQIEKVTAEFLQFALAEDTGSMADAVQRVIRLRDCARSLIKAIDARSITDVTASGNKERGQAGRRSCSGPRQRESSIPSGTFSRVEKPTHLEHDGQYGASFMSSTLPADAT